MPGHEYGWIDVLEDLEDQDSDIGSVVKYLSEAYLGEVIEPENVYDRFLRSENGDFYDAASYENVLTYSRAAGVYQTSTSDLYVPESIYRDIAGSVRKPLSYV